MVVRIAKMHDAGNLKEMNRELYSYMSKLNPYNFAEGCFNNEFIHKVIISNMSDFLIIEEGKEILGYAFVEARKTSNLDMLVPHTFVYINDICIKEEYRNKGIGKKLLESIKNWAMIRGLEYVELNVLTENKDAIKFYQKLGFIESQKLMRLDIK